MPVRRELGKSLRTPSVLTSFRLSAPLVCCFHVQIVTFYYNPLIGLC